MSATKARKKVTPAEVLASYMELKEEQRREVAEWIRVCARADLWLTADSVRRHSDEEIGELFGTRGKNRAPWMKGLAATVSA